MAPSIPFHIIFHFNTIKSLTKNFTIGAKDNKPEKKQVMSKQQKMQQMSEKELLNHCLNDAKKGEKLKAKELKKERKQVYDFVEKSLLKENSYRMLEYATKKIHDIPKQYERKVWIDLNNQIVNGVKVQMVRGGEKVNGNDFYQESLKSYLGDIFLARVKYLHSHEVFSHFDPFIILAKQKNIENDKIPNICGNCTVEHANLNRYVPENFTQINPFEKIQKTRKWKLLCHALFFSYYSGFNLFANFYEIDGEIYYRWFEFQIEYDK